MHPRKLHGGQALIEYLILSTALVFSIFFLMESATARRPIDRVLEARTQSTLDALTKPVP